MKRKIDGILLATFLTTIFYSATYPYIHLEVMSALPNNDYLALNQIVNCISIVVFGKMWNVKSDKLFKYYPYYCVAESIANLSVFVAYLISRNIVLYYILDTIVFATFTRNIICGGVKLRALRYTTEKEREQFDNNDNSMCAIATIVGSILAMFLKLDIVVMLTLAAVGNTIDNVFYIFIYLKTKRRMCNEK